MFKNVRLWRRHMFSDDVATDQRRHLQLWNAIPVCFCNPGISDWVSLIPGLIPGFKQINSDTVLCIQQLCYWSPWIVVSLRMNSADNGITLPKMPCQFHSGNCIALTNSDEIERIWSSCTRCRVAFIYLFIYYKVRTIVHTQ